MEQEKGKATGLNQVYQTLVSGNVRYLALLILLFSVMAFHASFGASCGTEPAAISSLIASCYPANIVNIQGTATPVNFQQQFTAFPVNALSGTVVLYNGISGKVIPAWVENKTIIWANLEANTIAASSSANGIYYFGICSSCNFFINGNDIGEAPQYTSPYAKYDNGNAIFQSYNDFPGTATPTGWTLSGTAWVVNNGITSVLSGSNSQLYTTAKVFGDNSMQIMDVYGTVPSTSGTPADGWLIAGFIQTGTVNNGGGIMMDGLTSISGHLVPCLGYSSACAQAVPTSSTGVFTANWVSSSAMGVSLNYGATNVIGAPFLAPNSIGFSEQGGGTGGGVSGPFYWIRIRLAPPNNMMPTVIYQAQGCTPALVYCPVSTTANPTAYETSSQTFSFAGTVNSLYTTANMLLQISNGIGIVNAIWSNQTVSGLNTFTYNYQIPLLAGNNIPYTFNAYLYTTTPLTAQGVEQTITQTEYENYFPTANIIVPANPSNVLLGNNLNFNTIITQVNNLNAITVAGYIQIGSGRVSEITTNTYTYLANAISFVPVSYGLTNPSLGSPVNVIANSILQLTFNANSVYRNITGINFQVYNESLTNCAGSYNTQGIQWDFYNVSTIMLWPANVLGIGHFIPTLNGYSGNTQPSQNIGFNSPATSNVYTTCIYPSWGVFNITGVLQYNASGSLRSTYTTNSRQISNALSVQRLYVEAQPAPVAYDIYVLNQQTQVYIASQVYVYSYYIGNDISLLLSQIQVPAQSGGAITLEAGNEYTFGAYSPNGQTFYTSAGPLTAQQCSSSPCSYIIYVNTYNISNPQNLFAGFSTSCTNSTTSVANQIIESCTYAVTNGSSLNMQLYGYLQGPLGANNKPQCFTQVTAASGTLSCTFNSITTMQYLWQLTFNNTGAYQPLNSGTIGKQLGIYGSDAIWFALLIILTLAFLFLTKSPIIAVIMFDIGWTVTAYIGLLDVTKYTTSLWIISAVILYLLNRK